MPLQKPGRSKQDYGTPRDFLNAVWHRFGAVPDFDLAATGENTKAPMWLGPGSPIAENSLTTTWDGLTGNLWLNPPYDDIGTWALKCARTVLSSGARLFFLVPASVGSNWFRDHVWGRAHVLALNPRLTFEGCTTPYPKDCILAVYGEPPGFQVWKWR